jgi:transcription termination factor NusB
MGESPRHLARELVLKRLYAAEIGEIDPDQILTTIGDDGVLSEKHLAFARE